MWSDFNEANKTRDAQVRADLLAGHARDPGARLRIAGRRRPAADADDPRPGRRRRLALPRHAAVRHLDLGDELRADVRARARASTTRCSSSCASAARSAAASRSRRGRGRRDDGHRGQGGAVQRADRADLAERGAAGAQPGVPLDGPRDHALGRLRPGGLADAAARRAGQARRPKVDNAVAALGARGRAPLAALRRLGRAALAPAAAATASLALLLLVALCAARCCSSTPACPRSRSCPRRTARARATSRCRRAFGRGRARRAAGRRPAGSEPPGRRRTLQRDPGIARVHAAAARARPAGADRRRSPAGPLRARRSARPSTGCGPELPAGALDRRRRRREPRPRGRRWPSKTPLVIGVVLALGFLLLLVALQAPVIAAVGVLTNLLATGAAFGVAKLIFQDGPPGRPARLRVAGLPRRLGARSSSSR